VAEDEEEEEEEEEEVEEKERTALILMILITIMMTVLQESTAKFNDLADRNAIQGTTMCRPINIHSK
jgi:hypothetical protein